MKTYILETENRFFISNNNEYNVTKQVLDITIATKFNYNDAISFSNLHFQVSNVKTNLIDTDSDYYGEKVYRSIGGSGLTEQVYKKDYEIDYNSRY